MALIPKYILILFFLIGIDYVAGIYIENHSGAKRKAFLLLSVAANIGVLFTFKYFNFFATEVGAALRYLHFPVRIELLSIVLPVGLSFHTFQSLSYVVEVYKRRQGAERDLLIYALYVLFWPQLVAGPIERPQNLLHQFKVPFKFNWNMFVLGARLILVGFIKKMVIADRLALYVNAVYGTPTQYTGWPLIIATYFFSIQIYCDFSGYTDIARGCARILGFNLCENFNSPYLAKSISDFWKRWHMSLSGWFRDYVYIPLGGGRTSTGRHMLNLVIVFLLSGLWHGANWTFVLWGALHSFYLIVSLKSAAFVRLPEKPWATVLKQITVFHLVTFAWIFFRAVSVSDAFYIIGHLFQFAPTTAVSPEVLLSGKQMGIRIALILGLLGLEAFNQRRKIGEWISLQPVWLRWGVYYAEIALIVSMGVFETTEFIYFQF